ncbi:tyrosine-type recombinase/integrase [Curtobacterium sp. 'Ferrero']|uniref:tyrosine-type recombinase/integrase n=1 Tax=Curtobacterium sp. 'Ferrero' TaxID=2033654 RepID=UPI001596CF24|nr:tyrosine-type recombinase/integrase [Curtobacterium sp. 'Ferrero']
MTWETIVGEMSAESRRSLAAALAAVDDSRSEPLESWIRFWFAHIHSKRIAPKTIASYRTSIEQYIVPAIGKTRLDKLTPQHVRKVEDYIRSKGLGGASAQQAHRVLSLALRDAMRDGRVTRNVATLVDLPKKKLPTMTVLDAAEGIRLLESVQHDRLGSRVAAALLTGARQGELLGLELDRVSDELDLSWQLKRFSWSHGCDPLKRWKRSCGERQGAKCPARYLDAPEDREYRHLEGGLWLSRPKSEAGWRIIPLVDPLRSIIERRVETAASEPNPHGLLWTSDPNGRIGTLTGRPIDPRDDNRAWHTALRTAGLPDATLHSARHTAVDLLYTAEDVDEATIAELVGHSTYLMSRKYRTRGNRRNLRDALIRAYKPFTTASATEQGGTT